MRSIFGGTFKRASFIAALRSSLMFLNSTVFFQMGSVSVMLSIALNKVNLKELEPPLTTKIFIKCLAKESYKESKTPDLKPGVFLIKN